MGFLWCLVLGDCLCPSLWLLFFSVPYLVEEFKITSSLLEPLVAWGTLVACAMARRIQLWTKVPPPHRDADRQAQWDWVIQKTSLSVAVLLQTWEGPWEIQGSWPKSVMWVLAVINSSLVCFKIHIGASISVWSHVGADLSPCRHDGCALLPDWACSSYRLCNIRVQISFALFSFRKKTICFVYPCKCQKCKILKSLPKKLHSFKKRTTEIVLLSYCLMNLLSPCFSARKWVLPCLKQGEFFPFICCSISSYQSSS